MGNLECIGGGGGGGFDEAGTGDGAGDVGDGGGGGEDCPNVTLREVPSLVPLSFSGVGSSSGVEADRRAAAIPLFLVRTAALLLARDTVNTAFTLFVASGLVLYTWACADGVANDG